MTVRGRLDRLEVARRTRWRAALAAFLVEQGLPATEAVIVADHMDHWPAHGARVDVEPAVRQAAVAVGLNPDDAVAVAAETVALLDCFVSRAAGAEGGHAR